MKILISSAAILIVLASPTHADQTGQTSGNMAGMATAPNPATRGALDVSRMTVNPAIFDPTHINHTHSAPMDAAKGQPISSSPALRQAASQIRPKN